MSISLSLSCAFPFFLLLIFSIAVQATVPPSRTFQFINQGFYGEYDTEFGATYRLFFETQTPIFAICFYNTTPGAYTLGLRMGSRREDSTSNIMRWIWDANRGNPVGEKATLTFGTNGNLVLADANKKVVWQTGTANKGVVGFNLLANGNIVLYDNKGRYVWQSFDYPTNSLLVGQGLRRGGVASLTSRKSSVDSSKGAYSMVLEKRRLALYRQSKTPYFIAAAFKTGALNRVVFNSIPKRGLGYDFYLDSSTAPVTRTLANPTYNTTLSFIRLEPNGSLIAYTFDDSVIRNSWRIPYAKLF